jgi:hypothetical protein
MLIIVLVMSSECISPGTSSTIVNSPALGATFGSNFERSVVWDWVWVWVWVWVQM